MDRSTDFTPFFSVEKDEIHRDFIGERSYKFLNFTPSNNGDFFHDMANHPIFSSSIEFLEFDNIGIQFLNETASTQQDLKMNTSSIKFDSSPSVKLPNNFDSLSRSEIEHMNMKQVTRENLCWDSLQNISSSSSSSQGTKFVKFKQNETPNSFAGTQENKDIRRRQLKLSKKLRNDFNHDYLDYRNNFEVENWRLSRNNFQYDLVQAPENFLDQWIQDSAPSTPDLMDQENQIGMYNSVNFENEFDESFNQYHIHKSKDTLASEKIFVLKTFEDLEPEPEPEPELIYTTFSLHDLLYHSIEELETF